MTLVTRREAARILGYDYEALRASMTQGPYLWPRPVGTRAGATGGRSFLYDLDDMREAAARLRHPSDAEVSPPDTISCLECGRRLRTLAGHLRVHGMTAAEYRRAHGLGRRHPLASVETRAQMAEAWQRRPEESRPHSHSRTPPPGIRPGAKLSPEGLQKHRAARAPRWTASLDAVCEWQQRHRTLPRASSKDPDERRLGKWLVNQRTAYHRGTLTEERVAILDRRLPEWLHPRQADAWKARALDVGRFMQEHGRLPTSAATDPEEKSLGQWLTRQRSAARDMPDRYQKRRRVLDQIAPGWLPETPQRRTAERTRIDRAVLEAARRDGAESVGAWITGWSRQRLTRRAVAAICGVSTATLARLIREHNVTWADESVATRHPLAELAHRLDRNLPLPRPDSGSMTERKLAEWIATHPTARARLKSLTR